MPLSTTASTSDLATILAQQLVLTHYQPIVSVKKRALLGYEALSRGCDAAGAICLPPNLLFGLAQTPEERLHLDRLCRAKALQGFSALHKQQRELVLTLNVDVSLLDTGAAGSDYLVKQAREAGVDPNNIVIEIIEANVRDTAALLDFTQRYRQAGFLIALDDVGAGHSNMERIAWIKPDIIKLDRSLISEIQCEFYKLEVTKSLVGLGQRLGAMVVAEGVESEAEALVCLELGVDVFQGYHFSRPGLLSPRPQGVLATVEGMAVTFRQRRLQNINARKQRYAAYDVLLQKLIRHLIRAEEREYDRVLADFMTSHTELECLYVLDGQGLQLSETVCNPMNVAESRRFIYQPAQKGADHSLKDYFLPLAAGLQKYTTEPYISMASGNLCTTIAAAYSSRDGHKRVVCIDICTPPESI